MTPPDENIPWNKEPYVWMIIGFPAAAVIAGIITIILAIQSEDGLVVDDYYKKGLEINRTLDRDRLAQQYNLAADIQYPGPDESLVVKLSANDTQLLPDQLQINLLHSTKKGFDKIFTAHRENNNQFIVPAGKLNPGRWHVLMETDQWRLVKVIQVN